MRRIAFICPFSRPANAGRVLANYRWQQWENRLLVVVENGPGLGGFALPADTGWSYSRTSTRAGSVVLLRTSKAGVSAAKNTALDWLAANAPDAIWSTMDDDDWYGPAYSVEVAHGATMGTPLWGKGSWFCHPVARECLWLIGRQPELALVPYLHGATLSGNVGDGLRFDETKMVGEDYDLCRRVRDKGNLWSTSRNHYCWVRHDGVGHTFDATDRMLRQRFATMGVTRYPLDFRLLEGRAEYPGERLDSVYSRPRLSFPVVLPRKV